MKPASPEAFKLLLEGSLALAQVEQNGLRIDVGYLNKTIEETAQKISVLQKELREDKVYSIWRKAYGEKAKLGSPEQLANVIFKKLGYPCKEYTQTSYKPDGSLNDNPREKADEGAFAHVDLPFVKKYFEWKKNIKMKNTYLEGIRSETTDGFLHPSFNLHTVRTFRSSSSGPNFTNIPIRNPEYAKIIRQCFIPRKGRVLIESDYAGIEVRVNACYNKDPVLLKYIKDPTTDMHREVASDCYLLDQNQIGKQVRYCGKNMFTFPEFYGSYYIDCAANLWQAIDHMKLKTGKDGDGISLKKHLRSKGIKTLGKCDPKERAVKGTFEHHIQEVERVFWKERFPVYAQWKEDWYNAYLKEGGFTTLTGFREDGYYKKNDVINHPAQGSAFHCLLWSLIESVKCLRKHKFKSLIVGEIHDSCLGDVPVGEVQDYLNLLREIMIDRLMKAWKWLIVPLDTEFEICPEGDSWFDKKEWVNKEGLWQPKK